MDNASIVRVMNTLRAEGLFELRAGARRAPPEPAAGPSPRPQGQAAQELAAPFAPALRLPVWLWPGLALCAATAWLAAGSGRLPGPVDVTSLSAKAMASSAVQGVQVPDPDAEAARLVVLLSTQGLRADVQAVGNARLVRAQVSAAAMPATGQALAREGLLLPHDGQLAVLFERQRL
jgi:hypothetical protein